MNPQLTSIVLKLLEWPFLLFLFLGLFVIYFRHQLVGILNRGDISISWGEGRNIRLRDLSDSLDEELDPIRDDIKLLKESLRSEKNKLHLKKGQTEKAEADDLSSRRREDALHRMREALQNEQFRWRSIDRLSAIAAVSESEAIDILRSDPEVTFSIGKSGRQIAKLKSR